MAVCSRTCSSRLFSSLPIPFLRSSSASHLHELPFVRVPYKHPTFTAVDLLSAKSLHSLPLNRGPRPPRTFVPFIDPLEFKSTHHDGATGQLGAVCRGYQGRRNDPPPASDKYVAAAAARDRARQPGKRDACRQGREKGQEFRSAQAKGSQDSSKRHQVPKTGFSSRVRYQRRRRYEQR